MLKIKDKKVNVLCTIAVLELYVGAILNADVIYIKYDQTLIHVIDGTSDRCYQQTLRNEYRYRQIYQCASHRIEYHGGIQ